MKHLPILALASTLLTACGTYSGRVGFENKCERNVWIAHVDGLNGEPPLGTIGSGLAKYAEMNSTRIPREVVIHWSYKPHCSDCTSKLRVDDSKMPGTNDVLVFRFTDERKWEAAIMR